MGIAFLNKEENEIIALIRRMPEGLREVFMRKLIEFKEELEEEEDIKDIIKRDKEPTVPADEVWQQLGLK